MGVECYNQYIVQNLQGISQDYVRQNEGMIVAINTSSDIHGECQLLNMLLYHVYTLSSENRKK